MLPEILPLVAGWRRVMNSQAPATHSRALLPALLAILFLALPAVAVAQLSVTPITWDVVGLDHNRPLSEGPELFPVGASVCSDSGTGTDPVTAEFSWDGPDSDAGTPDDWIISRPGSLTVLEFDPLEAGECVDAYFEIQVIRGTDAFEVAREYRITATAGPEIAVTPTPRQIFVERLVSQNRNRTLSIRWGRQADGSDWQLLGGGSSLNLEVGETYFIELSTETATAYEQIESFLTLSNTIFQVLSVSTDYSTRNFDPLIPDPNPSLYGDGCQWDPDPNSPNYLSCLATGKAGGTVTTVYQIRIVSGGGDRINLEALIYDFSGSSFHYNTDFVRSPGELVVFTPSAPEFSKRFIPGTIGADGIATVRFTISNPNPIPQTGYSFTDTLPAGMEVAADPNLSNSCGGSTNASAGGSAISLAGGELEANSSCTILVDVTVPEDAGASYPLTLENSVDLRVGDPGDPEFTVNATAELEVTEFPPPPQVCTPNALVAWDGFDSASTPTATADPENRSPAASGGAGLTFSTATISGRSVWNARANTANQSLSQALSSNAYYQFSLNTVGLDTVDFALEAFRQNVNAPESLTLFWGADASSLTQSATLTPVPTRSNSVGFRNLRASGLGNLDDGTGGGDGITVFRVYAYGASGTNQDVSVLDVMISDGDTCTDADPSTAPDPPQVSKRFESPPGTETSSAGLGQELRLLFTITNPNAAVGLTGLRLVDALPPGLEVVPDTFDNNCTGGVWAEDPQGVLVLEDSSINASATCTLAVDVRATSVGGLTNLSDPIDANETLAGNSARASVTVDAPSETPSMVKFFEPNPLFDPAGSTRLVFRITNNDSSDVIEQVGFSDTLPDGLVLANPLADEATGNCGSPTVSRTAADLLEVSGATVPPSTVCEISVDVELADPGMELPAWFENVSGPVRHVFNGVTIEGNQATATLLVDEPIPSVRLLKQVGLTSDIDGAWSDYVGVALNTDVYFRYAVENIGESELSAISLSDPELGLDLSNCVWTDTQGNALGQGFVLPVADFADPEAHIAVCIAGPETVAQAVELTTWATVQATAPTGDVQGSDDATVATAALDVVKSADPEQFEAAGETISYTFTVTNSGPAILSGPVLIDDPLIPDVSCPPVSSIGDNDNFFSPDDGELVCTGTYVTTEEDVSAGRVENTATATAGAGTPSAPAIESEPDTAITAIGGGMELPPIESSDEPVPIPVGGGWALWLLLALIGAAGIIGPNWRQRRPGAC